MIIKWFPYYVVPGLIKTHSCKYNYKNRKFYYSYKTYKTGVSMGTGG